MAREIAVTFALTAALKGGFKAAFQGAATSARSVASAIREMEKSSTGKLGAAMISQREKIKGLSSSLKEARGTLGALNAQAAAGGSTGMLARQIELAERRVNNLTGAMQRQIGIWKTTTAEAATAGGSVRRLAQDYEQLSRKMDRAKKVQTAMNANRAQAEALRSQRSDLNSRLAGAAMTAMTVAAPVKLSIDFEDAIASVGAVAKADDEAMARLTATARQLGRDTVFSAAQAAEGMKYLAMAGFDTNETIAAMPGLLDLAAAAGADLGRTSDIASDILTAFGLKASDMGQVGDTLAKAFTSSNTDLEMLGDTMKYVAPVAHSLGMTLQDTAAMAGLMANTGIKASQGGTVLRAAMLRLAGPPKMARDALGKLAGVEGEELEQLYQMMDTETGDAGAALQKLGMTAMDEAGNMRPMADILEELNARTAKMGTAEKAEVFKQVFGTEASAGMMALAEQAAMTVDKYGNKIVDSFGRPTNALRKFMEEMNNYDGTTRDIAEKRNATTGGALRRLNSAWQETCLTIGDMFLPAIKAAANALSGISNVISGAMQRFPNLSRGVALVTAGLATFAVAGVALGLVMNLVRTSINAWRGALLRLAASQVTASVSTGAMSVATGAFGIASRAAGAGARFFAGGLRSILIASGVGAVLVGLGFAINMLIDNWDEVVNAMSAAWGWVTDTWGRLGVFFSELGNNLAAVFPDIKDDLCLAFAIAWDGVTGLWSDLIGFFSGLWDSIWSGTSGFGDRMAGVFAGIWGDIDSGVTGFGQRVVGYFASLPAGIAAVFSGIGQRIGAAFSFAYQAVTNIWSGIPSFFSSVWGWVADTADSLWNSIIGAAAWAYDGLVSIWTGAVSFFDFVVSGITSAFVWARDAAIGIWNGITEFFTGVWQGVTDGASAVWQGIVEYAGWAFDGVVSIWNTITGFFSGIADFIYGIFESVFNWLQEKFAWVFSAINAVSSAIGKITGAISGAWNKAFGDDGEKESATPAVEKSQSKPAAPAAANAVEKPVVQAPKPAPRFQAVDRAKVEAAHPKPEKKKKASGGSRKAGASGGSSTRSGATGQTSGDSGPATIVSVGGDNSSTQTVFIPASQNRKSAAINAENSRNSTAFATNPSGAMQMPAIKGARAMADAPRALPQSPALISKKRASKKQGEAPTSINIDLKQNFELLTQDAGTARRILEAIKPDMEALVRRAMEKISSDKRRTAYAQ